MAAGSGGPSNARNRRDVKVEFLSLISAWAAAFTGCLLDPRRSQMRRRPSPGRKSRASPPSTGRLAALLRAVVRLLSIPQSRLHPARSAPAGGRVHCGQVRKPAVVAPGAVLVFGSPARSVPYGCQGLLETTRKTSLKSTCSGECFMFSHETGGNSADLVPSVPSRGRLLGIPWKGCPKSVNLNRD